MNFVNRHPLEEVISGLAAKPGPTHLSILRRPAILSVLAHRTADRSTIAALSGIADASLRFVGPGEWLLVSERAPAETLARDLAALGPEWISAVDQSDGRCAVRIAGPGARRVLSKCVAVDLHPDSFAEGGAANMMCCHIAANLARTGPETFEIVFMRSYAGTVFHELMEMGREVGLTAGFAD